MIARRALVFFLVKCTVLLLLWGAVLLPMQHKEILMAPKTATNNWTIKTMGLKLPDFNTDKWSSE